jgi:hypothetical protein
MPLTVTHQLSLLMTLAESGVSAEKKRAKSALYPQVDFFVFTVFTKVYFDEKCAFCKTVLSKRFV